MRRLLFQPRARQDLLDIWHYIVREGGATAASRVGEALDAAILELTAMPGMGHTRVDVKDARYRFWTVYSYVVAYRYDDLTVTIVRVAHGRRDFRKLFRDRGP